MKKLIALALLLAMCLSLVACGGEIPGDGTGEATPPAADPTDPTETGKVAVEKITDFGGYDFLVADWSSEEGEPVFDSTWEEFVYEYRISMGKEYNFTFSQKNIALTGNYTELVPAKIMAGDTDVKMYYFFEGYVVPSVSQDLLWDLNELDSFDPTDPKWNQMSIKAFTFNGGTYAVDTAYTTPLMGMFYNKRLLEEAGLDPELPYKLQAEGNWTWSSFEQILAAVTQDTDNDGVTDIWGFASTYGNMVLSAVWSNGAAFVTRDENGKFYDGTTSPEFLESMEWLVKLSTNGWLYKKPEGGSGNYALEAFQTGKLAFMPNNFWQVDSAYITECVDDWGFVYLPYGPSADSVTLCCQSYGYAIPKTFSKEEAEKIFQIYDIISDLTVNGQANDWSIAGADEYEDIYWAEDVANSVRDARAVDETLYNMMFNTDQLTTDYVRMVTGYNYANFTSEIINLKTTPQEKIESMLPANQAAINAANALLGFE